MNTEPPKRPSVHICLQPRSDAFKQKFNEMLELCDELSQYLGTLQEALPRAKLPEDLAEGEENPRQYFAAGGSGELHYKADTVSQWLKDQTMQAFRSFASMASNQTYRKFDFNLQQAKVNGLINLELASNKGEASGTSIWEILKDELDKHNPKSLETLTAMHHKLSSLSEKLSELHEIQQEQDKQAGVSVRGG